MTEDRQAPYIHPSAEADPDLIGAATKIWHEAQVMPGARVGARCTIGKSAFVGDGTVLGDDVKVGNHADVFGALVDDAAFLGPHSCLLEDPSPRSLTVDGTRRGPGDFTRRPVRVGTGASIGAAAVVLPGVTIGEHALVGAGAVVHRDVDAHAVVTGNPARQVGWVCRCGDRLDDEHRCACGLSYSPGPAGLLERT